MTKVTNDYDAPESAVEEAKRRNAIDGIPRHVYSDGRIMKYDWELTEEMLNEFGEKEQHG